MTMIALRAFLKANWLYLLIGAAILGAIWKIDRNGYRRAEAAAAAKAAADFKRDVAMIQAITRRLNQALADTDRALADKLAIIDKDKSHAQPIIQRELVRDPGLASAKCLTPGLLDAINVARGGGDGKPAKPSG